VSAENVSDELIDQRIMELNCVDDTFMDRLFSKCKIPNNDVCDDGENFLVDKECNMSLLNLKDLEFLKTMWFVRYFFIFLLFLFFKESPRFPPFVLAFIMLMIYNGAFSFPGRGYNEAACMDVNFLVNAGYCIMPESPVFGWLVAFGMVALMVTWWYNRKVY
jgi:hypothetical protein